MKKYLGTFTSGGGGRGAGVGNVRAGVTGRGRGVGGLARTKGVGTAGRVSFGSRKALSAGAQRAAKARGRKLSAALATPYSTKKFRGPR